MTKPTAISLLFLLRNFPPLFIVRLSLHGVASRGIQGTGSIIEIRTFLPSERNRIDLSSRFLKRDERIPRILPPRKSFFTSGRREKIKTRTMSHANHDARSGSVKTSYLERFRSAARDRDFHESRYTCPYSGGGFQWPRLNPRRYHWTAQMRRDSKRYQGSWPRRTRAPGARPRLILIPMRSGYSPTNKLHPLSTPRQFLAGIFTIESVQRVLRCAHLYANFVN